MSHILIKDGHNKVPYRLEEPLSEEARLVFKKAAQLWMDDTCIDLIEEDDEEVGDILIVFNGSSCWSQDGRQGGLQFTSFHRDCATIGGASNLLGHTLGLDNAYSMHDRVLLLTAEEEDSNV
ncbi:astacin [Ostertagia ostertagi]